MMKPRDRKYPRHIQDGLLAHLCVILLLLPLSGRIADAAAMDSMWQSDLLFHVNAARATHGLAPVQWNAKLAQAAGAHVADLQRCGKVAHEGCDGSDPVQRIRRAGYQPRNASENIGLCACDAAEVVRLWMQSENHRRNILHPTITEMGADTRIDPVDPRRALWVQVFGRE